MQASIFSKHTHVNKNTHQGPCQYTMLMRPYLVCYWYMWHQALDSLGVFCIYSMYKSSWKHMNCVMIWNLVTPKYQSDNSPEHLHSEIDESKASKWAAANSSESKLRNQAGRTSTPMAGMIRGKGSCEKNGISEPHKQEMGMIPLWPFFPLVCMATCTLFVRW